MLEKSTGPIHVLDCGTQCCGWPRSTKTHSGHVCIADAAIRPRAKARREIHQPQPVRHGATAPPAQRYRLSAPRPQPTAMRFGARQPGTNPKSACSALPCLVRRLIQQRPLCTLASSKHPSQRTQRPRRRRRRRNSPPSPPHCRSHPIKPPHSHHVESATCTGHADRVPGTGTLSPLHLSRAHTRKKRAPLDRSQRKQRTGSRSTDAILTLEQFNAKQARREAQKATKQDNELKKQIQTVRRRCFHSCSFSRPLPIPVHV